MLKDYLDLRALEEKVERLTAELATLRTTFARSEIIQRSARQAIADDMTRDKKTIYKTKLTPAAARKWRKETKAGLKKYKLTAADFADSVNVSRSSFCSYLYGLKHSVPQEVAKRTRGMFALIAEHIEKTNKKTTKK